MTRMRLAILAIFAVPAASIQVSKPVPRGLKVDNAEENVYIHQPKATLLKDIDEAADQKTVRRGSWKDDKDVPMTPVKMSLYPPLVIMTGNDRLSQGIQEVSDTHVEGDYEHEYVDLLLDKWQEHGKLGNLLDVGANMGAFTLPFSRAANEIPGAVVVSVEALPLNRNLLRASIKANQLDNIHLYEYAVGNSTWNDDVNFDGGGPNSGHAAFAPKGGAFTTQATTLDAILNVDAAMKKIFLMKLDIEGTEPSALDGGGLFMSEYPPCYILVELNRGEHHNLMVHDRLTQLGYEKGVGVDPAHRTKNVVYQQTDMKKCTDRVAAK